MLDLLNTRDKVTERKKKELKNSNKLLTKDLKELSKRLDKLSKLREVKITSKSELTELEKENESLQKHFYNLSDRVSVITKELSQ